MDRDVSVIFTTYNQPLWLRKVLWGYENQTFKNFEIVIADDGSGSETKEVIREFIEAGKLKIKHVWHPDEGYQKCKILNQSILAADSDYIIFSDGDCIPRNDFIETHLSRAEKGYFLSGGAVRLSLEISKLISKEDIESQKAFNKKWLHSMGLPYNIKSLKLLKQGWETRFLDAYTPAKATWNGGNSSGWKSDFLAINGFNEDMLYGGQDREFGERLFNLGVKSKQIRFSAVCLHLEHGRPYKNKVSIRNNRQTREEVKKNKIVSTPNGIDKSSLPINS